MHEFVGDIPPSSSKASESEGVGKIRGLDPLELHQGSLAMLPWYVPPALKTGLLASGFCDSKARTQADPASESAGSFVNVHAA